MEVVLKRAHVLQVQEVVPLVRVLPVVICQVKLVQQQLPLLVPQAT